MWKVTAMVAVLIALGGFFVATEVNAEYGTPQERAICYPDFKRLCPSLTSESLLVTKLACVVMNRSKFGKKCDAVLRSHGL